MSLSVKKDVKFSVKAVINKKKTKVLFAEIDSDLADVLFSFLTMPLGQIVRVLGKHYGDKTPVIGSLTTLYGSLLNLEGGIFWAEGLKQILLNPVSTASDECRKLKLDIADTQPTKYFICEDLKCPGRNYVGMYHATVQCDCGKQMTKEIPLRIASKDPADDDGVYAVRTSSFILTDDFEILPNATTSVKEIVSNHGLIDASGTECRNLTFGFDEIMELLLASLLGRSPLTCLILKKHMTDKPDPFRMVKRDASSYICNVKVIFQKSTTKLLFVEAEEDFVDFLFSLLVIPLGLIVIPLRFNTSLEKVNKLFLSTISNLDNKYLRTKARILLTRPEIPHGFVSRNSIFPLLDHEVSPKIYYYDYPEEEFLSHTSYSLEGGLTRPPTSYHPVKIRTCKGLYVRGPSKFMVKDDLTVTPFSMSSYLSTIDEQNIPFSDVDELTVEIRHQEALNILEASLSSTCALSKGLESLIEEATK